MKRLFSFILFSAKKKKRTRRAWSSVQGGLFISSEFVERGDDLDCLWEGFSRPPVVGEQDSPGLEVGDGSFNDVADFVDLFVELFFPVEEGAVGWFLDGGQQLEADVSFVSEQVARLDVVENSGLSESFGIVSLAGHGLGDVQAAAGQVGDDLDVEAGGAVLAGVQLWRVRPGPAGQQAAVDDERVLAGQLLQRGDVFIDGGANVDCDARWMFPK